MSSCYGRYRPINSKEHSPSSRKKTSGGSKAASKAPSRKSNKEEGMNDVFVVSFGNQYFSCCVDVPVFRILSWYMGL